MAQIYRKTALDKISSPEQLDKSLKITSPLSWLALIGLTVIVVISLIWACTGEISDNRITATGVLAKPEGVCSIFAEEAGEVIEVIDAEAEVHPGTTVMYYSSPSKQTKEIKADREGTVYSILATTGAKINSGEEVLFITPGVTNKNLVAVCYVKDTDAARIRDKIAKGEYVTATVTLVKDSEGSRSRGKIAARIFHVNAAESTSTGLAQVLGAGNSLVNQFESAATKTAVVCEFEWNNDKTDLRWTNDKAKREIRAKDVVEVQIEIDKITPIEKFLTNLGDKWRGK